MITNDKNNSPHLQSEIRDLLDISEKARIILRSESSDLSKEFFNSSESIDKFMDISQALVKQCQSTAEKFGLELDTFRPPMPIVHAYSTEMFEPIRHRVSDYRIFSTLLDQLPENCFNQRCKMRVFSLLQQVENDIVRRFRYDSTDDRFLNIYPVLNRYEEVCIRLGFNHSADFFHNVQEWSKKANLMQFLSLYKKRN